MKPIPDADLVAYGMRAAEEGTRGPDAAWWSGAITALVAEVWRVRSEAVRRRGLLRACDSSATVISDPNVSPCDTPQSVTIPPKP